MLSMFFKQNKSYEMRISDWRSDVCFSDRPACPEHRLKRILSELLDAGNTSGATLTDHFAMLPTAAVSGFYLGHPDASYFGVARVGEDQLAEYATRRGVDIATATQIGRAHV